MNGRNLYPATTTGANEVLLRETLVGSSNLAVALLAQSEAMAAYYTMERAAHKAFSEAQTNLDDMVNDAVVEADYRANSVKDGPLAGLARTSDAYKAATKKLKVDLLSGELRREQAAVAALENEHFKALSQFEEAKIRLGGMKASAELQAAMLRALSN